MNNAATINRNDLADNHHNQTWLAELAVWNAKLEANRTYRPAAKVEPTIDQPHEFFACLMGGTRKLK